jgi:hypothetical protein
MSGHKLCQLRAFCNKIEVAGKTWKMDTKIASVRNGEIEQAI